MRAALQQRKDVHSLLAAVVEAELEGEVLAATHRRDVQDGRSSHASLQERNGFVPLPQGGDESCCTMRKWRRLIVGMRSQPATTWRGPAPASVRTLRESVEVKAVAFEVVLCADLFHSHDGAIDVGESR